MKRRRFIQALAAAPAAPAVLAQQTAPPSIQPAIAPLRVGSPDEAADPVQRYFNPQQFAALRKLSGVLMPSLNRAPGAVDAQAPEFLDFLLSQSSADRQQLYRNGLDGLNTQSKKRFNKLFGDLEPGQAETLLAPLSDPWTYEAPADPVAAFLRAAKEDIRRATLNSREWSLAAAAGGARGGAAGLYWSPID